MQQRNTRIHDSRRWTFRIWGFLVTVPLLSPQAQAEEKFSFGAGIGAMYSGLGVNAGLKTDKQFKYIAIGCLGYSRSGNERDAACGGGVGIIRTDLFSGTNDKHGAGLHIGAVMTRNGDSKTIYEPGSVTVVREIEPVYGVGLSYVYFWNGLSRPGLNLGITPVIGFDHGPRGGFGLQIGYQFR